MKDIKAMIDYNTAAASVFKEKALLKCCCGRTFIPESLPKHQVGCP
jgi:hypothetical protein